jgi:sugar phosphate isomerase/epimerase
LRLALSTFSWVNHTLETAIDRTAQIGYEGIEIIGNRPHLFPGDHTATDIEKIRHRLDATGLTCVCVAAFDGTNHWSLSSPESSVRRATIEHVKRCVENAATLGAPVVESVSGKPVIIEDDFSAAWDRTREGYTQLAAFADAAGVTIGLEFEESNVVGDVEAAVRMLREVNSPGLGALIDLGHAALERYMTVADAVHKVGPWLIHVHADDNDGLVHRHLPIGEGTIHWPSTLQALADVGYDGWLTVEMELLPDPIAASITSKQVLENVLSSIEVPSAATNTAT